MSELLDNVANTITDIKDSILGDDSSDDEYVPPPPPPEEDDDDSSDDDNGNKPPPPSGSALDSDDDIIDDDDDDIIDDDDDDIIDDDDDDDDNDNSGNFNRNMMDLSQPSGFDNADIDSDDDDDDENYLQKFDETIQQQIITDYHPELKYHNHDEVNNLSTVVRNEYGVIIDPLHQSVPFITRYEKAKILGERAKQLSSGAKPFVEVEDNIIDEYLIALKEFNEKKNTVYYQKTYA